MSCNVEQMLFLPSGRKVWVIVGRDNEYWADPDIGFCSCKDYYFTTLSGKDECYHLKSIRRAISENKLTIIDFADDEYIGFLQAIGEDNINLLSRG